MTYPRVVLAYHSHGQSVMSAASPALDVSPRFITRSLGFSGYGKQGTLLQHSLPTIQSVVGCWVCASHGGHCFADCSIYRRHAYSSRQQWRMRYI
jgi:hypothetical protein